MISGSVVFYKIATTCLLIFAGFLASRLKILPEISLQVISKYVLYIATPAYLIFYMPASVSRETLHLYWYYPVVGFFLVGVGDVFSYICARIWALPGELATFRVLVALPNWIFMALAVCEPLFREEGVRVVLLFNLGITFYAWSFGMTSLRSGVGVSELLRLLFLNPQTVAAVIGFLLAIYCPFLRGMERLGSEELSRLPFHLGMITPVWETVFLLGTPALPLSIVQIGLLLGRPAETEGTKVSRKSLLLTSCLRLLVAPALALTVLWGLCHFELVAFTGNEFMVAAIIMAMPAATMSLVVVEVYGGAPRLAAQGILWMTIASLFTVPAVTWAAQLIYTMV